MEVGAIGAIIVAAFLVTLALGLPIAFCLLGLSILFMALFIDPKVLYTAYSAAFQVLIKDIYVAVPLFIFMATILQHSGMAERLYDAMYKWFAGLRGGLAIGTIVICTMIAAMTGVGATGTVTMGLLAFPEMEKRGYHKQVSLGCIPAGGSLGPLIPPSIIMIIIGGWTGISVGKLFFGGVFPGLLMSFLFIAYIIISGIRHPEMAPAVPPEERANWREKFVSLRGVILPIILIMTVLGTIFLGITTPSEAGGIGAFGALICAIIYRQLNWGMLKEAGMMALRVTCMLFWLIIGGSAFASLMTMSGVSNFISESLLAMNIAPIGILIMMMVIAFILGMLMDASAIIMICVPIFMPIVHGLGYDSLWFALLFTINMIIGYISPPFGMNLFYLKGIVPPYISTADIYRSAWPYVALQVLVLIVAIAWPPLCLWLPNIMIKAGG